MSGPFDHEQMQDTANIAIVMLQWDTETSSSCLSLKPESLAVWYIKAAMPWEN
jgi:hypothetical protein